MRWKLLAVLLVLVAGAGFGLAAGGDAPHAARDAAISTATVQRGDLSAMVSQDGILTYRARPDGSPYPVINRTGGTYTELPDVGDRIACGGVLYRVDDRPVVLLCGAVPAYRHLRLGDAGTDVRQLNRNLHVDGSVFTANTQAALRRRPDVDVDAAVFLPEPVRVAKVTAELGAAAQPGAPVLSATSDRLRVQVALDPSQQGSVKTGDHAQVTLPGNRLVSGRVEGFGRVASAPDGPDSSAAGATVPTYIGLDDVAKARGLDQAPVGVDITTEGVKDALSVPATALVGKAGGGFAVEVVGTGGRRSLVAVRLGLFDTGGGRVQVQGAVREGDAVVVPSP